MEQFETVFYFLFVILLGHCSIVCFKNGLMLWRFKSSSFNVTRSIVFRLFAALFFSFFVEFTFSALAVLDIEVDYVLYPLRVISLCVFSFYAEKLFESSMKSSNKK